MAAQKLKQELIKLKAKKDWPIFLVNTTGEIDKFFGEIRKIY